MAPPWRVLLLVLLYFIYLFLGATVFSAIEHPIEGRMLGELKHQRDDFLKKNTCVEDKDLEKYLASVIKHSRRGVTLSSTPVPNWSFGQSFFFSGTVITTIGYGQQTPLSTPGKVFCMIYALIGIPFTLFLLSILVEKMMRPVNQLLELMNSKLGHLYSSVQIRVLHLCLVSGLVLLFLLLLPALVLDLVEPVWSLFDSLYYCFISLTTVGLGDFIPGDSPGQQARSVYKTLITVYLIIGLVAVMTLVNIVTTTPDLDLTAWFRSDFQEAGDPERQRLQAGPTGQMYGHSGEARAKKAERRVVRARSRRDDDEYDDDTGNVSN